MHDFPFSNVWEITKGRLNSVMCALRTCIPEGARAVDARHLRILPGARQSTPPNPDMRARTSCRDPCLGPKLGPRRRRRWSCRSGLTYEVLGRCTVCTGGYNLQSLWWIEQKNPNLTLWVI